jgi:hypothetical protein
MGAELTEPMQLGLVTKAVAGMVLSFSKRLIKNLHYSFGESGKAVEGADEIELPHVTFPLLRGMDRLIISKPGDTPPALGQELVETEEQRLARRGGKGEGGGVWWRLGGCRGSACVCRCVNLRPCDRQARSPSSSWA